MSNPLKATEKRIWEKSNIPYLPEKLSVEAVGWDQFLTSWNGEVLELAKTIVLWEGYSPKTTEDQIIKREESLGINIPRDIYKGGVRYPGDTEKQVARAQRVLELYRDYENMSVRHACKVRSGCPDVSVWDIGEVVRNDHVGRASAGEEKIREAEERLGLSFPPSYRKFLQYANSWVIGDIYLVPIERVTYVRDEYEEWLRYFEEWYEFYPKSVPDDVYFQYGADQSPDAHMRKEYIPGALLISEQLMELRGLVLLNPNVVFEDGEWEAWLSRGTTGFFRFRSFKELMELLYLREVSDYRKYATEIGALGD